MKRIPFITILLLMVTVAFASVDTDSALKIEPQLDHRYASNIATRFLTNYHYKRTRLDDEISSEIFDHYFKLLDPNRIYFLAGDIEGFERYRNSLDDALTLLDVRLALASTDDGWEVALMGRNLLDEESSFGFDFPFFGGQGDIPVGAATIGSLNRPRTIALQARYAF